MLCWNVTHVQLRYISHYHLVNFEHSWLIYINEVSQDQTPIVKIFGGGEFKISRESPGTMPGIITRHMWEVACLVVGLESDFDVHESACAEYPLLLLTLFLDLPVTSWLCNELIIIAVIIIVDCIPGISWSKCRRPRFEWPETVGITLKCACVRACVCVCVCVCQCVCDRFGVLSFGCSVGDYARFAHMLIRLWAEDGHVTCTVESPQSHRHISVADC